MLASKIIFLAFFVIEKGAPVKEKPGPTFKVFAKEAIQQQQQQSCLDDEKVSKLRGFLPTHNEWTDGNGYEYRCQMAHGKRPASADIHDWDKAQYVTLYNTEDRIPVYSAYLAAVPEADPEPEETKPDPSIGSSGDAPAPAPAPPAKANAKANDKKRERDHPNGASDDSPPKKRKTSRREMSWEQDDGTGPTAGPKMSDYQQFPAYEKGHLFPFRFAIDDIQAQASMKLTNAVPQNGVFNKNQWSWAGEDILGKTGITDCQSKGGSHTAVVLTGAVPGYWGNLEQHLEQDLLPTGLKIGRNQAAKGGFSFDFPNDAFARRAERIRVPTHMWTACLCVDNESEEVTNFLGFIGLNVRVGNIKWYSNLATFDATLMKMYKLTDAFFPFTTHPDHDSEAESVASLKKAIQASGSNNVKHKLVLPENDCDWDSIDNSFNWLQKKIYHQEKNVATQEAKQIDLTTDNKWIHLVVRLAKLSLSDRGTRKKREVTDVQANSTFALVEMVDSSPTSNISLTQCTFKETYDGGEETHQLNFAEGVFVEDPKTTGEKEVSAFIMKDGNATLMPEKVSTTRHISIVLTPRN